MHTEGVFGQDGVSDFGVVALPDGVFCSHAEHIQRALCQGGYCALGLLDRGVHCLPAFPPHVSLFHDVVGDG